MQKHYLFFASDPLVFIVIKYLCMSRGYELLVTRCCDHELHVNHLNLTLHQNLLYKIHVCDNIYSGVSVSLDKATMAIPYLRVQPWHDLT